MRKIGLRRPTPALLVSALALFAALGGTVYAAAKIDGRTIKAKSLPGNRLQLNSVPGNRLKAGAIPGNRLAPGSITGTQIDAATLGQVPSAVHADSADSARDAQTSLNAINAVDATTVNGHRVGCSNETRQFAGACWQTAASTAAATAPNAALACANQGGELPEPLALAAFAQQVTLAPEGEWSGDVVSVSGTDLYAVAIVTATASVESALSTATKKFRCVMPLVS